MKIAYIAAGAAGMYCGSCLRDNAVARELRRLGEDALLMPLYTPMRVERGDVQSRRIFYGGISIYLEQKFPFFRKPHLIDRLLDSRSVLKIANYLSGSTNAAELGELTLSTLRGDEGFQRKELERLAAWLRDEFRPDLINLPNSMFVGAARLLRQATGVPVVCSLTGEDLFIEGLNEPYRARAVELLRARAPEVDRFIATSAYYAGHMSGLLGVDRERIEVVPLGLDPEGFPDWAEREARPLAGPFTIGYLARQAPEKGLHLLAEAFIRLKRLPEMESTRLLIAGYTSPKDRRFVAETLDSLAKAGLASSVETPGEVTFEQKLDFLRRIDVLSVPTVYQEPKGLFVLEAMAAGVPVVQPAHGAFPEIVEANGAGVLFAPGDTAALAGELHRLALAPDRGRALGRAGWLAVRDRLTASQMAARTREVYARVLAAGRVSSPSPKCQDEGRGPLPMERANPMSSPDILEVSGLCRDYPAVPEPLRVLTGIDVRLARGEAMAIMGPSGSGKSTFLQIVGTLDRPTAGEVRIDGQDPFALAPHDLAIFRNRRIGFIFQDHHLLPQCSVLENVMIPTLVAPPGERRSEARGRELLERVGLGHRAGHLPSEISGGERQRAAIARALINEPSLVLCDEPTGNLDEKTAESIGDLFLELLGELHTSMIVATHSRPFAVRFGRQFEMRGGKLLPPADSSVGNPRGAA